MARCDEVARQYAPRQFSLAGLLSFFVACTTYFGLLRITFLWLDGGAETARDPSQRLIWTIVVSWGGLWWLYRYWNLDAALAVHFTGPIGCGILAVVVLALSLLGYSIKESVEHSLYVLFYGPFISVLFGFPVAVVMLIYRGLKRD